VVVIDHMPDPIEPDVGSFAFRSLSGDSNVMGRIITGRARLVDVNLRLCTISRRFQVADELLLHGSAATLLLVKQELKILARSKDSCNNMWETSSHLMGH
jgi:hypothetical protein